MAEILVGGAFLSAFLNVMFDRLASRQVVHFFRKKKLDEKLLTRLKIALLTINIVLDDAEAKEVTHPAVKQWLEELKDVIYHAEDVLDEIVTKSSKPKKNIFMASKFKERGVEDIVEKIEYVASQKELLGLHERVGDNSMQGGRTTSLVESSVYGRDDDRQQIIESILMDVPVGDQISVITIVGMGGIGKTTLAKIVYNDEKVEEYFDVKAWVCVTQELDVFHITKIVLETVASSHSSDITDLNLLQLKLKQMLAGKKILLVLDDVWNEDYSKWRMLCAPFTTVSSGSKIIVTTRNDSVASIMRTCPSHSLEHLSDENGWKLFAHHAFESGNGDGFPHLEVIGKQVVKKCKGLPLAIKSLGGVLRNKCDVKVWENVMKSEFWDLPIGKTSILPALRLSYHYLPTHLKRCFAYCSIFPQDYEFTRKKLVLLWMAEGFLIDNTDKSMEELGEEYFDELFSRSFFQNSSRDYGTFFVMHDLNNDLARDVSGKFCLTLEKSKTCQLSEKVRHFSFSQGIYNEVSKKEKCMYDDYNKLVPILNAKYLRTFLPVKFGYREHCLSITIIRDLLPKLICIRVLSLSSYSNVVELPDSICTLIHLRYLDLSDTAIRCLPNRICQLYNLQTLLLSYCRHLIKLPINLGKLVNLRHLDIRGTLLDKLPPQIRKLESLQTLPTFIVGEGNCSGLGELKGFQHLKGSLSILGLRNVTNVEDAIEANLKEKTGIEQLLFSWDIDILKFHRVLEREDSKNDSDILDNLEPGGQLNHLTINRYGGTHLSNWLGDGSLSSLTYLSISNCTNCLSLPSLGELPSLVELHINGLHSVRRVDSKFYGNGHSSIYSFKKLVILEFGYMSQWEEWLTSGGGDNDEFPKLETLSINWCPKLCGNLPKLLSSLRDLNLSGCRELTAIIPGTVSLRSLKLEGCKNVEFENMTNLNYLISLEMGDLQSNSFPKDMIENCNNIEELRLSNWSALTHFPDDGLPATLRTLEISSCNNLKFLPNEPSHNYNSLTSFTLSNGSCDSMTSFPLGLFPNLNFLIIKKCKNLESFSIQDDHHEKLESLQTIRIQACPRLTNFPSCGLPAPNLKTLKISNCKNLKWLPEGMNTQLTSLQYLIIHDCEEVESFPAGGLPSNLRTLSVSRCKKAMAKRREWELHTLLSLDSLTIVNCEEIESFPEEDWQLPTSLTTLTISESPNLKRIDVRRLLNLSSLTTLEIKDCPKVKFNPKLRNTQDLPTSFIKLSIEKCPLMKKQLRRTKRDVIPFLKIDSNERTYIYLSL